MNEFTIEANFVDYEDVLNDDIYVGSAMHPIYPGYPLNTGSIGSNVSIMQSYLNAIRKGMFPSLSRVNVDGIYGSATKNTVTRYQGLSGLKADGIIGRDTWDSIVEDYDNLPGMPDEEYPGYILRPGSAGAEVGTMQTKLNRISPVYTRINFQTADGIYGNNMANAVRRFQHLFGMKTDGVIGPDTWNKIISVHRSVEENNNPPVSPVYPGYALNTGSSGDSVREVQSFLNFIRQHYNYSWQPLNVDGIYGRKTKQAVTDFQAKHNLKADGITGRLTWDKLIIEHNKIL